MIRRYSPLPSSSEDAPGIPAPPAVRHVLENHCIICHDADSARSPSFGWLDMSHWVDTADGQPGFVQLRANGEQRPSLSTFKAVLDRMTTSDDDAHMPLGYVLKFEEEFAPFKAWLDEQIARPRTR